MSEPNKANIIDYTLVPSTGSWGSYDEENDQWSWTDDSGIEHPGEAISGEYIRKWILHKFISLSEINANLQLTNEAQQRINEAQQRINENIDRANSLYGPYESVNAAIAGVPESLRTIGLTVAIIDANEGVIEYQWKKGTSDQDLVKKIEDIISTAELIAPDVLNYVDPPQSVTFYVLYSSKTGGRISIRRNGIEIEQQNILPGLNTYTVSVPQEYLSFTYSISIKDILGQDVVLDVNSFTVRVGTIKIKTDLLNQLVSNVLGNTISTLITVQNLGNPAHLYFIDEDENETQIPGTNFNSYLYTFDLSQVPGDHSFKLKAVSLDDNGGENPDEVDEQTFTYARLTKDEYPYKIIIDAVNDTTTAERVTIQFHYQAYDAVQKLATFIVDGREILASTYFIAFVHSRYTISPLAEGTHRVRVKIEDTLSDEFTFNVTQYTVDENIIPGSIFQFDSVQSEVSGDYTLEYSGISEGVNGVDRDNSLIKFSGESRAILKRNGLNFNPFSLSMNNGATIELLYNTKCIGNLDAPVMTTFLNKNDTSFGVEVTYKLISVGIGGANRYSVDVSENTWIHATVVFSTTGFGTQGLDNLEDVINDGYMYIYINGCMVYVQPLSQLPEYNINAFLSLNVDNALSNYGECSIRTLRFYNTPLSPTQVVSNYINSIVDPDERELARGRNQLDLPVVTFKEKEGTPYFFTDLLGLVDKSLQKKQLVTCETTYQQNSTSEAEVWQYTTVATQGTSTLQFPIKNFKVKIYANDALETKLYTSFNQQDGWDSEYVYTLKCDYMESSHLNNTPTCGFFNNMVDSLIADGVNFPEWTYDTVSPARSGYIKGEGDTYKIREYSDGQQPRRGYLDAIKGFPCVVKYVDLNNSEHYLGTYMFNLDKEAKSLGFEALHKDGDEIVESQCVSIEGKSNTDEGAGSFCSFDYWLTNKSGYDPVNRTYDPNNGYYAFEYKEYYKNDKNIIEHNLDFNGFILYYAINNPGKKYYQESGNVNSRTLITVTSQNSYYNQDFETRYVYNEAYKTDPSHWHNWINAVNFISESYEIVQSPSVTEEQKELIKLTFKQYFGFNYCLLYYLQMIVFAQVDNAGKNCMWDTWDGIQWFPRPYDQDTMAGLDNSGLEIIDPDVEYNQQGSPGNYVDASASLPGGSITPDINQDAVNTRRYSRFNTSGSRMWVLFKTLFDSEIKDLYRRMRNAKVYDSENIINYYFSKTSDIIGETYYNKDSVVKFIQPPGTTQYLDLLHGNRRERFKYWITTRIKFCDTLFGYNRNSTNPQYIRMRINPTSRATLVFKTYNPIYIYMIVGTITGNNQDIAADAEYHFFCSPESQYEAGKEGVQITIPVTSGDKEVAIFGADSIKEIEGLTLLNCKVIDISRASKITTLELTNLRNLTSLVLGNNQYLQTLIAEGLTGITNQLDLTGASNIKTVSLRGSTFNNLSLTTEDSGTTVKDVNISNTAILELRIKQAPFLRNLNVDGCNLLNTLVLNNCNIESIAFSSLPELSKLNLIECNRLKSVDISDLSYFQLDGLTFSNCPLLEDITMKGVYNVGDITTLSLESIVGLKSLDLSSSLGIYRIGFDTDRLTTLKELNVSESEIVQLNLPSNSIITSLNCNTCNNLQQIAGLNANLSNNEGVFNMCPLLTTIQGPKLKSNTANNLFAGCYRLSLIDVDDVDFTEASDFTGAFAVCCELPWDECKKVLRSSKPVDASYIFTRRYYKPVDGVDPNPLATVPADIFNNIPNVTNLSRAFSYYSGSLYGRYIYSVPEEYVGKISTINAPSISLSSVTTLYEFAYSSDITELPSLTNFPNVTNAAMIFANCDKLTTIPANIFNGNTKITDLSSAFYGCTGVTSSIGNMLSKLTNLETILGMFYNCSINGTIPKGFFVNNKKLTNAKCAFYLSGITGVQPLFHNSSNLPGTGYTLKYIDSMFGRSLLSGNLPEKLFEGCTTITNAGRFYNTSIAHNGSVNLVGGVFGNTNIQFVPQGIFDSLNKITTGQGMFLGCASASFPLIVDEETHESEYNFLSGFTKITNCAQMFAGCTGFSGNINARFIPSTATNINGMFAYSGISNVIELNYLTNLTTAAGTYAHTSVTTYPNNIFKNLDKLTNVSHFFEGCVKLDRLINEDLFSDCAALVNTSYMFSHCETLGDNASTNTLPDKLFKNNLLLINVSHMFECCYDMFGTIPDLFDTSTELQPDGPEYEQLTNMDYMFYRSNFDVSEGHIFSKNLLYKLTKLQSAKYAFSGINYSGNPKREGASQSQFSLHPIDSFTYSAYLKDITGIFKYSNLTGAIDNNLFRPSINSNLLNISQAFGNTAITSVGSAFLIPSSVANAGKNNTLTTVNAAFINTQLLESNIPECNDKSIFTQIKNSVTSAFHSYAYNTTATNKDKFTGLWSSSSSTKQYPTYGSVNRRENPLTIPLATSQNDTAALGI